MTTAMGVLPTDALGSRLGNLEDQRQIIVEAIDFLLQGF